MTVETMSKSAALYERAKKVLPGGVSRNTVLRSPHPYYAAHAEGCRVTDIEGVERIDFANNMASLIHGHSHPAIVAAVTEQLGRGTAFTLATEVEVAFAEHLLSRNDQFDKLRFVNSGTEATMTAVKAARAFTGRSKMAKVEGAYHGQYDYTEVSQTANPNNWGSADHPASVPVASGTPKAVLADVVVIPFDDPEHARRDPRRAPGRARGGAVRPHAPPGRPHAGRCRLCDGDAGLDASRRSAAGHRRGDHLSLDVRRRPHLVRPHARPGGHWAR